MRRFLFPFVLGFLATSSQILLLREFSAYFYGNELTFGIVLAAWLLWGGIGSLTAVRIRPLPNLAAVYALVIFCFPLALIGVRFSRYLFHLLPGEIVGLSAVILISLGLCLLIGFPLGALFALNVRAQGGNIARVYLLESLGAAAAGPVVFLLLLPFVSSWLAAAIVGGVAVVLICAAAGLRGSLIWAAPLLLFLGVFSLLDFPGQRLYWRPFELVGARDTRYGRLQFIRTREQLSLYSNGAHVYSYPDLSAAEEAVHFAALQMPGANRALLIGGGAGGAIRELLKYPDLEVDYVELDPGIISLSQRYLDEEEKNSLGEERVYLFFDDGRSFLRKTKEKYDLIILNLPEPATAQLNRFYTIQFFLLARDRLVPDGVFSFSIPSAENYISPELQQLLSSLYFTLSRVFRETRVVPGDRNIFLASGRQLTTDAAELGRRMEVSGLRTVFVHPQSLLSRLHPLRLRYLEEKVSSGAKRLNSDLTPVSFFFQATFWSTQFRGPEARILRPLSALPPAWLLFAPLLLISLFLVFLRLRRKSTSFFLTPLVTMGLTTIVAEIVVLVWFQALYGYLYGRIALLLAAFMLGLFFGGLLGSRSGAASFGRLLGTQSGFLALILLSWLTVQARPPEFLAYLLLFLFGGLGGDLFIVSNRLYLSEKTDYGKGYGLDLGGSFIGALVTSSLLIPLAGLSKLLAALFLLNLLCLFFLLTRPKNL
ncbi:MAG: hypothetical protein AB1715_08115 [Acidobacteriota bacterium]